MITRKWVTNVWRLITFSIIIIIAVWVMWFLIFFYKKALKNKSYLNILWSKFSSLSDIQNLWLCKTSSYSKINYNPIDDTYTLTCEDNIWDNISKFPEIITISDCLATNNFCKYKFRK